MRKGAINNVLKSGICKLSPRHNFRCFRTASRRLGSDRTEATAHITDKSNTLKSAVNIYDSLSQEIKTVDTSKEKGLAWYTCGPTTYAPAHLGHARTYVWIDITRRLLEYRHSNEGDSTPPPLFVMNVTDVDDKILKASQESQENPTHLARRFEEEFWADLDSLNCLRPHVVTRVSEHVESSIIPFIEKLFDSGMAYALEDGLYFDVRTFDEKMGTMTRYGKLAPSSQASDFFTNNEQLNDKGKRDPRDFALWKLKSATDGLFWDSPWGQGRPGWHIECSAMIRSVQDMFQDTHRFRIHAGGVDLKFPHHTNEIAQSEAFHYDSSTSSSEWIPHWVHTGHLHIDGRKMSKSLKNFVTIRELLAENNESPLSSKADDFRMWCLALSGSYRVPATYSEKSIAQAQDIRLKLVRFLLNCEEWLRKHGDSGGKCWTSANNDLLHLCQTTRADSEAALSNDLDGKSFVDALLRLAHSGEAQLKASGCPAELVHEASRTVRHSLKLAGFSTASYNAGLAAEDTEISGPRGEDYKTLLDDFIDFRTRIRQMALLNKPGSLHAILEECDSLRNGIFPRHGIALFDEAAENAKPGSSSHPRYTFILPEEGSNPEDSTGPENITPRLSPPIDLTKVAVENLFRTGIYQDLFSEFDDRGIPTHHADGSTISNRQRKKLTKKHEDHIKRLAAAAEK